MNIKELYQDYLPTDDIFIEEPDKIRKVKKIIFNRLTQADRNIILLYAELQSIRKLSKVLNVSAASAWLTVDRIRKNIKEQMGEHIK